jgi:hypothetical protein
LMRLTEERTFLTFPTQSIEILKYDFSKSAASIAHLISLCI